MEKDDNEISHVFVLGAGFTIAFFPSAPLVIDDYYTSALAKSIEGFPYVSELLDHERHYENDKINIEKLMTRLHERMPYDNKRALKSELDILLEQLKINIKRKIEYAKDQGGYSSDLHNFAKHCIDNRINCITLNYDDFLDEAIYNASDRTHNQELEPWHPDGGYGFFCKPARDVICFTSHYMELTCPMLLLKLHGSINWYPKLGTSSPYSLDSLLHLESWCNEEEPVLTHIPHPTQEKERAAILSHLESQPFMVPPVLSKSPILEQPVLSIIWDKSYDILSKAKHVTFIGYRLSPVDLSARFLFEESLNLLYPENITVVNLASNDSDKSSLKRLYRDSFGNIPDNNFYLDGALPWSRNMFST